MIGKGRKYTEGTAFRLLLILLCFLLSALSEFFNSDAVILSCVTIYFVVTYKVNPYFLLKYIGFLAQIGIGLIGVFIIENNIILLTELQRYSHHAGSYPLFAGYYLLFILSLELFDKHYIRTGKDEYQIRISSRRIDIINKVLDIFGYSFYVVTVLMTLRLITHPYYLVGLDRFQYRQQYIEGIWEKIANYYTYFIPLLLMNWHRNKHKKLTIATFVLYIFYLFIQGEKYGGFITVLLYISLYFVPELMKTHKSKIRKVFRIVIVVFCAAFAVSLLQYQILFPSMKPLERTYQRFAQQGQLWWSVYDLQEGKNPHPGDFSDELAAYSDDGSNKTPYYAIYKIMYLSAPSNVVTNKIATGSTYTESTVASLYYYFGPLVLPMFAIVMGWFFSFLSFKFANYIRGKCIIEVIVVSRLIALGRGLFGMSRFTWLFDIGTLVTLVIWGALVYIRKTKGRRGHNTLVTRFATNDKMLSIKYSVGQNERNE